MLLFFKRKMKQMREMKKMAEKLISLICEK